MSGHSKFSNIKHKKERADAVKGKVFTKLGREIAVAVKAGGADPASNMALKNVISKAKAENMPNDTIDRSIKKASGDLNAVTFEKVVYEGYGPNGVAIIVEALTDNRTRTAANVRNAFTKGGGSIGAMGCVSFIFTKKGLIFIDKEQSSGVDADELMELLLEAGAEDFESTDDGIEITTAADETEFSTVNDALSARGIKPMSSELTMVPGTYTAITDDANIKKMNKLLDLLDDDDDVTNVYHNWEQ